MKARAGKGIAARTFLFLQGPSSPLFARIADNLEAHGHRCLRVNFCLGDRVFWRRKGARNFRGRLQEWPDTIAALLDREHVDGVILLGEERPHHRIAVARARARGIDVHAVEMGYFRPDWIVLERGGSGCNSHFPTDPARILRAAERLPDPDFDRQFAHSFASEAFCDLLFNLPNVFPGPLVFPHYRRHGLFHPLAEYGGWIRRFFAHSRHAREAAAVIGRLKRDRTSFFLCPLQLETDYQIRSHSPFESQRDAIARIVRSFAANAPGHAELVFKLHPLDNGLIDWRRAIERAVARHGVGGRVVLIDGGDLDALIARADGVVTINSTVGLRATAGRTPTKALGVAIYDIAGLCHQGTLDRFWVEAMPPDDALRVAFLRLLAASIHVRGNFYSRAGVQAAAKAISDRLHMDLVNEPAAFVSVPPRARPVKETPNNPERLQALTMWKKTQYVGQVLGRRLDEGQSTDRASWQR